MPEEILLPEWIFVRPHALPADPRGRSSPRLRGLHGGAAPRPGAARGGGLRAKVEGGAKGGTGEGRKLRAEACAARRDPPL
eukprot:gene16563-13974_t